MFKKENWFYCHISVWKDIQCMERYESSQENSFKCILKGDFVLNFIPSRLFGNNLESADLLCVPTIFKKIHVFIWIKKLFSFILLHFHCHRHAWKIKDSHQKPFWKITLSIGYPYKVFHKFQIHIYVFCFLFNCYCLTHTHTGFLLFIYIYI